MYSHSHPQRASQMILDPGLFEAFPGLNPDTLADCVDGRTENEEREVGKREESSVLTPNPTAKNSLRNKQLPTAVQSITLAGSKRWGKGECSGRCCCVYKPDRWSAAPTRTIKQKTTGCF